MKKNRVLLADEQLIILAGLRTILKPEFAVVGAVADGRTLVAESQRLRPDLVVAEISMPVLDGIEAARRIKKLDGRINIVFFTTKIDIGLAARALEAGATGIVLKNSEPSVLLMALREAMLGRTSMDPSVERQLMSLRRREKSRPDGETAKLSPRQREVLQLFAEGKAPKDIAAILHISSRTVEFHKYRMMDQLAIKTNAELIQYAVKCGLTPLLRLSGIFSSKTS